LCAEHHVELIAIGNGTASRETDKLAGELIRKHPELNMTKIVVSEAGASVYSASALAAEEFPDLDVSYRGAVSIARRLQDPLAELVKIEPKAIGVGQYQHDVNQAQLVRALEGVVEDCVNAVGVDANTASVALLTHIAGLNKTIAQNLVNFRNENGAFRSRDDLKKVPRLGAKTFEQAAGFLRVPNGDNPLDASGVHPEAYPVVEKILRAKALSLEGTDGQRREAARRQSGGIHRRRFGLPTVQDILAELEKPGRDPRPAFCAAVPGRRHRDQGLEGRHGAGRRGHQRHQLRRVCRHRRASGRPGAHLDAGRYLRQGASAHRGQGRLSDSAVTKH
jgi:uncharacterized protein